MVTIEGFFKICFFHYLIDKFILSLKTCPIAAMFLKLDREVELKDEFKKNFEMLLKSNNDVKENIKKLLFLSCNDYDIDFLINWFKK